MVLEVAQTLPAADTLVIEDRTHQVLQPHDRLDQDALHLAHMLDSRLPDEANLHPAVIGWDYGLGVYVQTEDQQTIIFGQYEEIDRKIALLTHMLQTDVAFTYLDLRPSNPFYQNKPAAAAEGQNGSARQEAVAGEGRE
jgi:cell division protein FtsQ